jgi:phage protein D
MSAAEYKILFDGTAATADELGRFEAITVEQEAERPSQARLELSVCLDDQGNWSGDDEPYMQMLKRVRVELRVGEGDFEPLIDGPIVGFDSARSAAPGQSTVAVVVHDDSALMHRAAAAESYPPGQKDSDIATRIFGEYAEIASTEIEVTPDAPDPLPPELRRRGTHMQLLRRLARRNDLICAVIPGDSPGASIGVFHSTPVFAEEAPPLVLVGAGRNIESFDVELNAQQQSNVVASTLSFSDKSTVTCQSKVRNLELIGQAPPLESDDQVGEQLLQPGVGEGMDLQHRVDREARRTSRVFTATGSVRQACYPGVLKPFHPVQVQLGTTPTSGTYVIERVMHRLGRSDYRQDFTVVTDSLSETAGGSDLVPAGLF